jgi:hypothetical protein
MTDYETIESGLKKLQEARHLIKRFEFQKAYENLDSAICDIAHIRDIMLFSRVDEIEDVRIHQEKNKNGNCPL